MENGTKPGKICLNNMEFYGVHGVPDAERRIKQLYIISVSLDFDFEEAAKNDDLSKTINYAEIYQMCRKVLKNEFKLIETIAYNIAHLIKNRFPDTENIEVSVKKPQVQMKGKLENAEVVYNL
ncbi:MAG: dihydroneopterin aldolase [Saprospiraceae bacterium]|nr:dihydroneopterin aldolase [Saprospiraceae bacterium]